MPSPPPDPPDPSSEPIDDREGPDGDRTDDADDVLLSLPDSLREALKEPFGPVHTDPADLLARVGEPLVAVGDAVTYHLVAAGRTPDVAVLDGRTERSPVEAHVRRKTGEYDTRLTVRNPPATLTAAVLDALREALERDGQVAIDVNGEEDLVALPAIVAAPSGASVVYGQPGEGMVLVPVNREAKRRTRTLLERMDGDHAAAWDTLGSRE